MIPCEKNASKLRPDYDNNRARVASADHRGNQEDRGAAGVGFRGQILSASSQGNDFRICCMVHSSVGCSVTPKCTTRRRSCDSTTKTNRTRNVAVGTVKKSIAAICARCRTELWRETGTWRELIGGTLQPC